MIRSLFGIAWFGVLLSGASQGQSTPLQPGAIFKIGGQPFSHGSGWEPQVVFAPDGKTMVSLSTATRSAKFWDVITGQLKREVSLGGRDTGLRAVAISRDASRIVAAIHVPATADKKEEWLLRIWDAKTGDVVRSIAYEPDQYDSTSQVAFLPDGKTVVANLPLALAFWEVDSGAELLRYKFSGAGKGFTISADGKTVIVPVTDKAGTRILIWEWETNKDPRTLDLGSRRRPVGALALSPDGKRIAFVDDLYEKPEIWDTTTGKKLVTLASRVFTRSLTFSSDGTKLATADEGNGAGRNWSGGIILWDAKTGQVDSELPTSGVGVRWVTMSPDGKYAVGATEHGMSVWDVATKKELGADGIAHRAAVHVTAGPGTILTFSDDHTAKLWDAAAGQFKQVFRHSHWIRGAAISPDGSKVVTSALADEMAVWDAATGKKLFSLSGHGTMGGDRVVAFSADGKRIISYGDDYYLRITDLVTGKAIREFAVRPKGVEFPDEDSSAMAREMMMLRAHSRTALSQDGRLLVVPTQQSYAVFDTDSGKETLTLAVDRSGHTAPSFSPDGKFLLTLGQAPAVETKLIDGRTRHQSAEMNPVTLWDTSTGKPVYLTSVATSFDGKAAFRPDGKVYAIKLGRDSDRVGFFDAATGKQVGELVNPTKFGDFAFSPEGKRLYAAMRDTSVLVYDVPELKKP